jgi:hypothetical protein
MTATPEERQPLAVTYEIRVVHGEEAKLLRRQQAEAIRALLLWLAKEEGDNSAA